MNNYLKEVRESTKKLWKEMYKTMHFMEFSAN